MIHCTWLRSTQPLSQADDRSIGLDELKQGDLDLGFLLQVGGLTVLDSEDSRNWEPSSLNPRRELQ
jgi:hypothetical protein